MTKPEEIPQDVWDVAFEAMHPEVRRNHAISPMVMLQHLSIARAIMAAKAEERTAIIYELESLKSDFLSTGYSVDQPDGSFTERFAVGECINAIRNRDTV